MSEYGLFIRFEDQSESFTLGFEAGMVYEKLLQGVNFTLTVHKENARQLENLANKLGYLFSEIPTGVEDWIEASFEKTLRRVK